MKTIHFFGKEIPVRFQRDCIVVGGGTAGSCAAIRALLEGADVLVVERMINLGGTQTNALVSPMMPTAVPTGKVNKLITDKLHALHVQTHDGSGTASWFNTEALSYALQELIITHGGEILYDATFIDCIVEQNQIKYIIVQTIEGLIAIEGKQFVDATADAALSRMAGVTVIAGNDEGNNQQISFRFEMGGIDITQLRNFLQEQGEQFGMCLDDAFLEIAMVPGEGYKLEPLFQEALVKGLLKPIDLKYFQAFTQPGKPNVMSFNCPHIPDVFKTVDVALRSQAVIVGRQMQRRLVAFLQQMVPGFAKSYLLKEASQLGIRDSYRIVGKHVLTEASYFAAEKFADGVARGDWYIDVHDASKTSTEYDALPKGAYYEIPYRSMITNEIENMVVAGRHISASFLMQASVRIQPTLRDVGSSAGLACAYALQHGVALNAIDGSILKEIIESEG